MNPQTRVMTDHASSGEPQPYDMTTVPPRLKSTRGSSPIDPRMREQVNPDVPNETCPPDMTTTPLKLIRRGGSR